MFVPVGLCNCVRVRVRVRVQYMKYEVETIFCANEITPPGETVLGLFFPLLLQGQRMWIVR